MAKKKKPSRAVGAAVHAMPRNTVSLILDGTVEQYLENYERSLSYFRCWMLCKAAVRVRIGNRLIYTTLIDETFYFCLRYHGRYIVFPIVARMAWLVGFYTANGAPAAPAPDALAPAAPAPTPAPDAPAPAAPALDAPAPDLVPASDAPATCDARDPVPSPLNLGECVLRLEDLALSGADLHSLEGQNFLLDGVINFVFAQMSATFAQQEDDDIVLVSTGLSSLLANLQDPDYVATSAAPLLLVSGRARLVLFPVNDNDNLDLADGGTHWSLLVLHIAADGSSRFVHHDSMGFGGANLRHARRLVDTLRPLLHGNPPPLMEGFTPRQEAGSNDCGLYVLAVSQAICNWWRDGGRNGSSNSWITAVEADVDAARVQAMRDELLHNFKGQTGADPSSSK